MMRIASLTIALAAMLAAAPAIVHAQPDIFGPRGSAWGPRLDTVGVSAASRVLWRGYDSGVGARAAAAIGIWGRSVTAAGAWHVSATTDAIAVDRRAGAGTRAEAALEVGRLLGGGTVISASGGGYWLEVAPGDGIGAEFGLRVDAIPLPFVPEVWPTIHLRASRATGPLDATFLGALIRQEVGLQQYAVRLEIGADTDDASGDSFASPRWHGEAGIARGIDRWMIHADGGAVRNAGATLGWVGAGISWRF